MAVSARFQADFASFFTAVQKAEVSLRSFEDNAAKVEKSLNRVANSLSGARVVQDATLMAEAVERVGGVSKLTEAELGRVAATAAEAAEKLTAMGKDVPPQIAALASHAKTATSAFDDMRGIVSELAGVFGVAFSVQQLASFVSGVAQTAKGLRNLSLETGIGTTQLQLFGAVTGDLGVTTEELGKAIFQLSNRIAGNDASAAGAIHTMGLTLEELKGKSPEELFTTMLHSVDQIPDHLTKVNTAADLFGSRVGGAVLKVAHNFDEAVDAARSMNKVMSEEAVQAAAKAADNYDRLTTNIRNTASALLGPMFEGFNQLVDSVDKGNSKWDVFATMVGALSGTFTDAEGHATTLKAALDHLNESLPKGDINLPAEKKPTGAARPPTGDEIMLAIRTDQLKALTSTQEKYLEQLFDMNKLTEQNAAAFGVSAEQMAAFRDREEQTIQTQSTLAEQLRAMKQLQNDVFGKGIELLDKQNEKAQKQLEIRTAYMVSLQAEVEAAKKVNLERNLGPGQADPGRVASERRDRELAQIEAKQALAPSMDLTPLIQKTWQDFDAMILGAGGHGVGAAAAPNVNVSVSGVWDPASVRQLTDAISEELMRRTGRKFGSS